MLRDALYDIVPLADAELRIIDSQAFLRLERIQQLGFVSRVWPGARHTRFEHSIGVFHLARQAVEHLRRRPDGGWITDEDARTICAAALLHELTRDGLELPWHLARKRMTVCDEDGRMVEALGTKFETFVFDALARSRSSVTLEVAR